MNVSKPGLPLSLFKLSILVTTIAGPLGEDEEEIGEERDQDMSSEEEYDLRLSRLISLSRSFLYSRCLRLLLSVLELLT